MHAALVASVWLAVLAAPVPAVSIIYLSTQGNDSWTGTLPDPAACKCDGPLLTLPHAASVAAATSASQLLIRGGTYRLSETLVLKNVSNLLISSYNNEDVVVSGGAPLGGDWGQFANSSLWMLKVQS